MIIFGNGEHFIIIIFFIIIFSSSPFCLLSLAVVVAAAAPRAGSRVKSVVRGGRAGGAAATRGHFASRHRCSRRGQHQGLQEGTARPAWVGHQVNKTAETVNQRLK